MERQMNQIVVALWSTHPPGFPLDDGCLLDIGLVLRVLLFRGEGTKLMVGYSPATVKATKSRHQAVGRFYFDALAKKEGNTSTELIHEARDNRAKASLGTSEVALIAVLGSDQLSRHNLLDGAGVPSFPPNPELCRIGDVTPLTASWQHTQRRVRCPRSCHQVRNPNCELAISSVA